MLGDLAKHDPAAVLRRSDLLLAEERVDENALFLSDAARQFPEDADIQLRAAAALFDTSPTEAAQCVRRAADAAPTDANQLTRCGLLAFDLRDYKAAKEYAIRVRDLEPDGDFELAASLVHLTGKLARVAGQADMAEQALRLAFEKDPEMAGHGRVLAAFLAEEGRVTEALDVVAEALRHRPNDTVLVELEEQLRAEGEASPD